MITAYCSGWGVPAKLVSGTERSQWSKAKTHVVAGGKKRRNEDRACPNLALGGRPEMAGPLWGWLCGLPAGEEDLVVAHFFDVFYVGLDGGEEGSEFGAAAESFEVAFFGVPLDA
jgi:hypothetical protein